MIDWSYFIKNYLSISDILMLFIWLMVVFILTFIYKNNNEDVIKHKFYGRNVAFKLFFAFAYAFYYGAMLKGGDTNNYWRAARLMADMFYNSPLTYFQHLNSESSMTNFYLYFNSSTGYPEWNIYRDSENYFTSKVFSVLAIITAKGYLAATFIMAFLTAHVHWRLFNMLKKSHLKTSSWMPILFLFMPSVAFWASGISKDTLMLLSTFGVVYWVYSILLKQKKISLQAILAVVFYIYLIYHVRTAVLAIVVIPFMFAAMHEVYQRMGMQSFLKKLTQVVFNSVVAVGLILFLLSSTKDILIQESAAFNEALVTQQDFRENKTYGDKKYDLQLENTSFFGVLAKSPLIVATGIYRPFLWEALSISLFLNGIESVVLLLFSWRFVTNRLRARVKLIRKDGLLSYSTSFVLLTAFISGFISILFGVLVRFRAPLLPFIGLLLTAEPPEEEEVDDRFSDGT